MSSRPASTSIVSWRFQRNASPTNRTCGSAPRPSLRAASSESTERRLLIGWPSHANGSPSAHSCP
eukprot:3930225-Prymnesium_polylepis.1